MQPGWLHWRAGKVVDVDRWPSHHRPVDSHPESRRSGRCCCSCTGVHLLLMHVWPSHVALYRTGARFYTDACRTSRAGQALARSSAHQIGFLAIVRLLHALVQWVNTTPGLAGAPDSGCRRTGHSSLRTLALLHTDGAAVYQCVLSVILLCVRACALLAEEHVLFKSLVRASSTLLGQPCGRRCSIVQHRPKVCNRNNL